MAHTAKECFPKPNAFSSCADLMSNIFLRASIWSLGVLSVIGNTVVIIWRFFDTKDSRVILNIYIMLKLVLCSSFIRALKNDKKRDQSCIVYRVTA